MSRKTILDALDDGTIDSDTLARMCVGWMSESEAEEFCTDSDFSEYLPEPEPEPEVDGVQFRYIVINSTPATFYAEVYSIDSDGDDSVTPVYLVTESEYNDEENSDVDFENCEETVDWFLKANDLPYADHYLDQHDDVVMT